MRDAVFTTWLAATLPLEGRVYWPYVDVLGIPSTGIGNAFFSFGAFSSVAWMHVEDGAPATADEVRAVWLTLSNLDKSWWPLGGGNPRFAALTPLRLTDDGLTKLVRSKVEENEEALAGFFKNWATLPDAAQVGTHLLAWAVGVAGITEPGLHHFPKFAAALAAGNYATCAVECVCPPEANPGNNLTRRNIVTASFFNQAAGTILDGATALR